jgi:hypothetical protein
MTIPLNEHDLNVVKGLVHYAEANLDAESYDVEIKLGASSGDVLGTIMRTEDGEYQFYPGIGAR